MRHSTGPGRVSAAFGMLFVLALLTITLLSAPTSAMGVVAFDYGTEWMKVSLVKPGLPFDVILDRDSKRKIQSAVSFKKWGLDEEILFGTNAYNHATREPKQSFYGLKTLLGRTTNEEDKEYVNLYTSIFGNDVISSERGTCSLQRPYKPDPKLSSLPVLTVEELVGMQLEYAKKLAEETAGERVNPSLPTGFNIGSFGGLDAVVTVPAFFNAQERQAIVDSAILAGFRPRLVSDGAAAAVNYAQTRSFPLPEKHLFFDVGSGSVRATVVEFSTKPITIDSVLSLGKAQKEATIVDVKGVGWERNVGGLKLDLILRDKLAADFDAKYSSQIGGSIRNNHRAMARLLKEANRVKHILSANDMASSSVESLVDEIDFRTMIQRQDFEDAVAAAGMVPKFTSPINQALSNAGLKLSDINSIVLVGGSTRVPLVQNALQEAGIPDSKLAQNVNADEAAVMGAAFYGASFNPQFRMKEIRAYDLVPYAVNLKKADDKTETIFPAASYEVEQVLRQYENVKEDFIFELEYDAASQKALGANTDRAISMVEITGIDDLLKDIKASGQLDHIDTQVNLTVSSKPLGTYAVENVVMVIKPKAGGIAGALKSFFGVSTPKKAANGTSTNSTTSATNGTAGDAADAESPAADADAEGDETLTSVPAKDKIVKLTARTIPQNDHVRPLSGDEIKKSKDKLWIMSQAASRKAQREEARNAIESYLYRVRDLMDDPTFASVSKDAERKAISAKTEELSAWLSDDGETADTSTLKLKRASLESLIKPLETRLEQNRLRDTAFAEFEVALEEAKQFVAEAKTNLTAAIEKNESSKYSVTELDSLSATIEKDGEWFKKGKVLQEKKGPSDDPALLSTEVDARRRKVAETINKIKKRRIAKTRSQKKPKNEKKEEKKEEESPRHEEL
ncbi:related to glucose regulated stress protein, HSP70-like [Ustilago bromivora]|uniref:Related to glucose regulated stress protein, HSP70-like n=1 Tax=Ustilago bromivora TaxID=307758 RepID=A0A1K0GKH1_9BASI|nr:related to glucose regulated stress protein, HSP70-like [Ustilago bromivora]SYW74790.1 related to glucose regulated stress protein, HSP70-like [Ustilago bromivora]